MLFDALCNVMWRVCSTGLSVYQCDQSALLAINLSASNWCLKWNWTVNINHCHQISSNHHQCDQLVAKIFLWLFYGYVCVFNIGLLGQTETIYSFNVSPIWSLWQASARVLFQVICCCWNLWKTTTNGFLLTACAKHLYIYIYLIRMTWTFRAAWIVAWISLARKCLRMNKRSSSTLYRLYKQWWWW